MCANNQLITIIQLSNQIKNNTRQQMFKLN